MCSWVKVLMHRSEHCRYTDRKNMAAALVSWNTMLYPHNLRDAHPPIEALSSQGSTLPLISLSIPRGMKSRFSMGGRGMPIAFTQHWGC